MSNQRELASSPFGGDVSIGHKRPSTHGVRTIGEIIDFFLLWQARTAERTHLASLPDYLLRDMGLSREQVELEAAKPFWKA